MGAVHLYHMYAVAGNGVLGGCLRFYIFLYIAAIFADLGGGSENLGFGAYVLNE